MTRTLMPRLKKLLQDEPAGASGAAEEKNGLLRRHCDVLW